MRKPRCIPFKDRMTRVGRLMAPEQAAFETVGHQQATMSLEQKRKPAFGQK